MKERAEAELCRAAGGGLCSLKFRLFFTSHVFVSQRSLGGGGSLRSYDIYRELTVTIRQLIKIDRIEIYYVLWSTPPHMLISFSN